MALRDEHEGEAAMIPRLTESVLRPVPQDTMSAMAYTALRVALLRREFEPDEQLDLVAISHRLQTSLTPVKEALRRLHEERLVEIRPRAGTYVTAVTVDRLREVAEARLLVEQWGIAVFPVRVTAEDWAEIDRALAESEALASQKLDDVIDLEDRFAALDHEFHRAILASSGNESLVRFFDSLGSHVLLARAWCLQRGELLREQVQTGVAEHRAILDALRAADEAHAERHMTEHIEHSVEGACQIVDSHGGRI